VNPIELNAWLAKDILVHERSLRAFLSRFFKSIADIEDAVQETYARLIALNDPTFLAVRNWHAFLFTTARNVALDRLRKARVVSLDAMAEMGGADVLDEAPPIDEELNARQELALLLETIASLPNRCRETLTLRKLYGMSQREIARRLNISESTVEKHVAYGVRLCAERMFAKRDDEPKTQSSRVVATRKGKLDEL
jgi:RNA polymerase sigma factor (sigma-70 family)